MKKKQRSVNGKNTSVDNMNVHGKRRTNAEHDERKKMKNTKPDVPKKMRSSRPVSGHMHGSRKRRKDFERRSEQLRNE